MKLKQAKIARRRGAIKVKPPNFRKLGLQRIPEKTTSEIVWMPFFVPLIV